MNLLSDAIKGQFVLDAKKDKSSLASAKKAKKLIFFKLFSH